MKKALSLALALMMLISMICAIPVMADEPDGSQANPYYVANPMTAPSFISIPANSAVYYQYNAAVFNGWTVEGYGLTAITVDGATYDQPDMWGALVVTFNFTMMSPGIVGYVNGTDEDINVMLTHSEPIGSLDNPAELSDGENAFSIPANIMDYVAIYVPMSNGDYTFSTEQGEDFQITIFADASPDEGGTPIPLENGSLTLTLESYIPVYVVITPVGITGDVVFNVTPPKAGTAANPIWVGTDELSLNYTIEAGEDLYMNLDGSFTGNSLTIESVAGAEFTALVDGVEYASEGGKLTCVLDSSNWAIELVLSSAVANEVAFEMIYAPGTEENPIVLEKGDNVISIPTGVSGYYYSYVVESDGLLIMTPASVDGISYLSAADADYADFAYLEEGASSVMLPVTAGETILVEIYPATDDETWESLGLDTVLTIASKELVLFSTFEDGDMDGWSSKSPLSSDDMEYISGWYSAKFEAAADWANMYRYINVEKNTDYNVTFKAKAAKNGTMWTKFHKADWSGDVAQGDANLTTEWADYEFTLNSGDNTSLVFMFQNAGYAADGQIIWLDDVVVTKVAKEEPPVEPEEPIFSSLLVQFIGRLPSNDPKNGVFVSLSNDGETWTDPVAYNGHGMDMWGCSNTVNPTYLGSIDVTEQAKSLTSDKFYVKVGMGAGDITWTVLHQVRIAGTYTGQSEQTEFFWDDYSNLPAFNRNGSNAAEAAADVVDKVSHIVSANHAFLQQCNVDHQATGLSPYHGGYYGEPENVNGHVVYAINQEVEPEPPVEDEDNLIVNGSFETGDATGWQTWQSTVISADAAKDGAFGAHLIGDGGWGGLLNQTVAVEAGKQYKLSFWINVNAMGVNLQVKDGSGNSIKGAGGWYDANNKDKYIEYTFTAPDNSVLINFCGSGNQPEDVYVDNLVLEEIVVIEPSFDGYITNGDFETGAIAPWDNLWGSCPTVEIVEGMNGGSAVHVVSKQWCHVRQTAIAVEANTDYKITVWAKNTNNMCLLVKDGADTKDIANVGVSAGDEWTEFTVEFNSGEYTTIIFSLMGGEGTDQYGIFDNIVMEKVEPKVIPGDANGDGNLNNRDLGLLQKFLNDLDVSGQNFNEAAADVNGDGNVNNRDLGALQLLLNA